jgi:hypothetical protein
MLQESEILFESGSYWVLLNSKKNCYEVYKAGITHSVRCASIGVSFGMDRVKAEIIRRQEQDKTK